MAPFLCSRIAAVAGQSRRAVAPPDSASPPRNPPPAPASVWEWIRAVLLAANLAWTTLCLGGVLPGTRGVTACLTALLVAAHFADPARGRRAHSAGWLFIPFLAYAACNAAWVTPVHWLGWTDWLNWTQGVAVFWVVLNGLEAPACRRFLCTVMVAIGALAALLALYQHFVNPEWIMLGRTQAAQFIGRSSGPFGIPNSMGVLMALLIPPVGALAFGRRYARSRRLLCALSLCLLCAGFVLAISRGAWFALAAAFALKPLISRGSSFSRRIAVASAAVATAAAVVAALYFAFPLMRVRVDQLAKDSGEHTRPIMWRGALGIFEEHPVWGGGAGSFDTLFEPFRPEGYRDQPVYAHSDYLNTLCDYGVAGFLLFFGAAALVAWKCAGARGLAGAAFTGLLAFALHLLVDFHLKIPALAMTVATVAALVTREAWPGRASTAVDGTLGRVLAGCTAAAALGFTAFWIVPKFRGEEFRRAARARIERMASAGAGVAKEGDALALVRSGLSRAVALDPRNAQAWSDRAYAESLSALVTPAQTEALGVEVERDAARAIALCPVAAEFWIRRGTGLDMQHRWTEGGDCFVHALTLAPLRADIWYYEAYHLSLAPRELGPALADAEMSLRLDPGFLLAQSLRQRLATQLQSRTAVP
jgi:O-antigen ligase